MCGQLEEDYLVPAGCTLPCFHGLACIQRSSLYRRSNEYLGHRAMLYAVWREEWNKGSSIFCMSLLVYFLNANHKKAAWQPNISRLDWYRSVVTATWSESSELCATKDDVSDGYLLYLERAKFKKAWRYMDHNG